MNRHVLKQYCIRDVVPVKEPQDVPVPLMLPPDHPCRGGIVLRLDSGTPYCFLPRCDRDIFKLMEVRVYHCVKYKHLQLLQELRFLPFCSRNEFQIMKSFLQGEPLPNTDDEAEMALARKYFTAPEAEEFNAILTARCQLGDISRAAAFFKLNHMSYGATMTSFSARPVICGGSTFR